MAAGGAVGVALDAEFAPAHVAEVVLQQSVVEGFAKAGEDFDGFHGAHAGDGAGDGAEDGELAFPQRWWFGDQAAQAGGFAWHHGGDGALHFVHGAVHHRDAFGDGGVVDGEALFKKRCGVHHQVDVFQ